MFYEPAAEALIPRHSGRSCRDDGIELGFLVNIHHPMGVWRHRPRPNNARPPPRPHRPSRTPKAPLILEKTQGP